MAVYSFGFGKFGQLGQVTEKSDHSDPVIVSALKGKRVVGVSCGESHSLAITEYGDLYTWGRGFEGQLGHGDRVNSPGPRPVDKLAHERIVRASCGHSHTVALTDTGKVYQWGKIHKLLDELEMSAKPTRYYGIGNSEIGEHTQDMLQRSHLEYLSATTDHEAPNGDASGEHISVPHQDQLDQIQLGQEFGRFANVMQPTPLFVEGLRGKRIVEIAAGYACTAAITDSGELYTWGFNEKGQLGLGHRFNSDVPRLVHALNDIRLVSVACGSHHTVTMDEHGNVYTFGLGVFGQLGHGNLDDLRVPKRVEYLVKNGVVAVQIVCGAYHTVARTSKGELYSFGHGEYGQHGGVANYSDWGNGEQGGKEAHLQNSTPRLVKGFDQLKITHIACGQLHSVAITDSHQVYTWGWGAGGCLGHGDARYQLVPRLIASLQGDEIISAAAGWKHSLVIKSGTSTFAFDFKQAINNPKYSDLTFIVQNKKIHAHKVIICARCPSLYTSFLMHARFVGNGVLPNEYIIKNVRVPIFTALLNYLYTDHLICPAHLSKELAMVAKRFNLPRLESLCKRADYRAWARFGEPAPTILPSTFCSDMSQMVNAKDYSDIVFKLDTGETLKAHKVILAARSDYFHRMFEGNFKERNQDSFNCDEGQSLSSFLAFLSYLYTGDESIVQSETAVELLGLADRMIVDDLKQLCEYYLERLVSSSYLSLIASSPLEEDNEDLSDACENTVALLEIGDKYEAKRLKRVCLEAVCGSGDKNWQLLSRKQAFTDLRIHAPVLFRELDYLASKNGLISDNQLFASKR